jgi:hypothetical protein
MIQISDRIKQKILLERGQNTITTNPKRKKGALWHFTQCGLQMVERKCLMDEVTELFINL